MASCHYTPAPRPPLRCDRRLAYRFARIAADALERATRFAGPDPAARPALDAGHAAARDAARLLAGRAPRATPTRTRG